MRARPGRWPCSAACAEAQKSPARLFDFHEDCLPRTARYIVRKHNMPRWTPHDLRRTAATMLDIEGYSLEQIGGHLAHTRKGVTAIYARANKFNLRREMAQVIEKRLRAILAGEAEVSSVVALRPSAA